MQISHVLPVRINTRKKYNTDVSAQKMSKRKQSSLLTNFGFTSKKPNQNENVVETPCSNANVGASVASTALATSEPSHSPEQGEVVPESSSGDKGDAEAASISDLPAGWTTKQVGEWKERNAWLDFKAGKLGCSVCWKAKSLLLSEKGPGIHLVEEWINGEVSAPDAKSLRKKIYKHRCQWQG